MPSSSQKNFGYWRNRAREAESKVESQERLIDSQQKQIDELTNKAHTMKSLLESARDEAKNLKELIDQKGGE